MEEITLDSAKFNVDLDSTKVQTATEVKEAKILRVEVAEIIQQSEHL
jgi:hypothetical protein